MRVPVQRLSRDFAGSVKYSTSWPWRRDSPSDARRAIPMSLGEETTGRRGKEAILIFAFCSLLRLALERLGVKAKSRTLRKSSRVLRRSQRRIEAKVGPPPDKQNRATGSAPITSFWLWEEMKTDGPMCPSSRPPVDYISKEPSNRSLSGIAPCRLTASAWRPVPALPAAVE